MKKNIFTEKRIIFADGSSEGSSSQTAAPVPEVPAIVPVPLTLPDTGQLQPPAPEKALAAPEVQKAPEAKQVTENDLLKQSQGIKDTAANKMAATGQRMDILSRIKVEEIKMPA